MRRTLFGRSVVLLVLASSSISNAQESPDIAGRWVCDRLCAIWDSTASITIDGEYAVCKDERGDVSRGHLLTGQSVRCFDVVGQLTGDGETINWTNGKIWRRDHRTSF